MLFGLAVFFQFPAERRHDFVHRLDVLDTKPLRKSVDPRGLQMHGGVEGLPSLVGEHDELRSSVMRIGFECNESFRLQVVDDALDVLAVCSHFPREPCNRLRPIACDNAAENLPTSAGQAKTGDQPVACCKDAAAEPEQVKNEIGQSGSTRGSFNGVHLSP